MSSSPYTEFFLFTSKALPQETFHVVNFHGTEGLNQLFSFTINLVSQNASVDPEKVLAETATLTIKRKTGQDAIFTGYPTLFEQSGFFNGYAYYQLELRPAFWKLTQAVQSAIFLKKNVQSVLDDLLNKEKFFILSHEFKLAKNDYPTPEFAMQYGESIYEYILWRIEEQGIYFYFTPDGDKIIFADGPTAHDASALSIRYSPVTGLEGDKREEVLTTFTLTQTPLPQKVIVRSYDWKKPNTIIVGSSLVSKAGVGEVYLAGENAETEAEANRLAKIRAEELICRSRTFHGAGSVPVLRPGVRFTLTNHYNKNLNRDYVVTEITHEGAQETFLTMGLGIPLYDAKDHLFYHNSFKCIENNVTYRPARMAKRASIPGVIRAFVDGAGSGTRAELDEYGRYKVLFPFDLSGRGSGNASCWIRMAQPQVGKDSGLSFPLLPGAEVTVAFIDGNPDRPVITGALPNGETGAITGKGNTNFMGIRTPGGNQITINDTDHKQGLSFLTASGLGQTQSEEAGSNTTTMTSDDYVAAAGTTSLDWSGICKNLFTGYSAMTAATRTKSAASLWGILLPNILKSIDKNLSSLSEKAAKAKDTDQANGLNWGASSAKLAAQLCALSCGIVSTSALGKGDYGITLTTSEKASRNIVQVYPVTSHLITQAVTWIALRVGSAAADAVVTSSEEKKTNEGTDENAKKYAKHTAWRKGVVNLVADLLPDITAFITTLIGKAARKDLGGVLLQAIDKNINLIAGRTISAHSNQGIYLRTTDLDVKGSDANWGIDDESANGYSIDDFVKNTPFVAIETSAAYTRANKIKSEATTIETSSNSQKYLAKDGNAGVSIAEDEVSIEADKDGHIRLCFHQNNDAPDIWVLTDGITVKGPKGSSNLLLSKNKALLQTDSKTKIVMEKDSINLQSSGQVNVSGKTIELATNTVKAANFTLSGCKIQASGPIDIGGAIKVLGGGAVPANDLKLKKAVAALQKDATALQGNKNSAMNKMRSYLSKAKSEAEKSSKEAEVKSIKYTKAVQMILGAE